MFADSGRPGGCVYPLGFRRAGTGLAELQTIRQTLDMLRDKIDNYRFWEAEAKLKQI
ncbi:hypothetical protein HPL003_16730 [Paenibacillus terrae HPL-003]|uniref:Uncharacterized protein n=1 Tax=Paenibacillus terrae (strain HPL-003) TaxID=985665 RepID=G7W2I8_PAETH|nr:hypothetical protein [Paenibacillus terrae]AET60092.1 hypothetical protein HPL003_16730 [Paenibacillus terrae HPL-003]